MFNLQKFFLRLSVDFAQFFVLLTSVEWLWNDSYTYLRILYYYCYIQVLLLFFMLCLLYFVYQLWPPPPKTKVGIRAWVSESKVTICYSFIGKFYFSFSRTILDKFVVFFVFFCAGSISIFQDVLTDFHNLLWHLQIDDVVLTKYYKIIFTYSRIL